MPAAIELDAACAAAIDLAHDAAVVRAGVFGVGEHTGVVAEGTRVATHLFGCPHPGYPGWQWTVTVARAARARVVTVSEVTLMPAEGALLPPAWVPWSDRITAGDVSPGVLLATSDDDPRLEPGFTGGEAAGETDAAEASQIRAVVAELGLGRERVLSPYGRDQAVERWLEGPGGPDNVMTQQAPALCESCGYFVRLSGSLGRLFGACTNEYSPQDGQVVSHDHGCGGHSDVADSSRGIELPPPIWDSSAVAEMLFD